MSVKKYVYYLLGISMLMLGTSSLRGQETSWEGHWKAVYQPWPHLPSIELSLHIAEPVHGMLYPTRMELKHGHLFSGTYQLLLVKKNDHQLGVSRNKYPLEEEPYGLGPWMMYLNGVLDANATRDTLTLERVWLDNMGVYMNGVYDNEFYTNTKIYIREFLYHSDIKFTKVSATPWLEEAKDHIVYNDSIYYGVYDPIATTGQTLHFFMQDEERYDRDSISVVHNGKTLVDHMPVDHAMDLDSIVLEKGENYIAFFADNYGDLPPNTASFIATTTGDSIAQYQFDFRNRSNAYATVMVANFNYEPKQLDSVVHILEVTPIVPPKPVIAAQTTIPKPRKEVAEAVTPTSKRKNVPIGSWTIKDKQILLELWDGRIEDGDTISLSLNDKIIEDHMMVTKKVKKLWLQLEQGENRILFTAENLGEIPPNTAIMRITADGRMRRFYLHTDFDQNNVLYITVL